MDGGRACFIYVDFYVSKKTSHAHAVARLDANEKHNILWQCEFLLKGHTQAEV